MIKSDVSDDFLIFFTTLARKIKANVKTLLNEANKVTFKQQLSVLHCQHVNSQKEIRCIRCMKLF